MKKSKKLSRIIQVGLPLFLLGMVSSLVKQTLETKVHYKTLTPSAVEIVACIILEDKRPSGLSCSNIGERLDLAARLSETLAEVMNQPVKPGTQENWSDYFGVSAAVIMGKPSLYGLSEGTPPLIWKQALGSDVPGKPLTSDQLFNVGSITKNFTASLFLQENPFFKKGDPLAGPDEKGDVTLMGPIPPVSLNEQLGTYFPVFTELFGLASIRNLLHMNSGIENYSTSDDSLAIQHYHSCFWTPLAVAINLDRNLGQFRLGFQTIESVCRDFFSSPPGEMCSTPSNLDNYPQEFTGDDPELAKQYHEETIQKLIIQNLLEMHRDSKEMKKVYKSQLEFVIDFYQNFQSLEGTDAIISTHEFYGDSSEMDAALAEVFPPPISDAQREKIRIFYATTPFLQTVTDRMESTEGYEGASYGNVNYLLLGALLESLSAKPLEDNFSALFEKAGLADTHFMGNLRERSELLPLPGRAWADSGYLTDQGDMDKFDDYHDTCRQTLRYTRLGAAGSIVSTATDISKWLDSQFRLKRIIPEDNLTDMQTTECIDTGWASNVGDGISITSGCTVPGDDGGMKTKLRYGLGTKQQRVALGEQASCFEASQMNNRMKPGDPIPEGCYNLYGHTGELAGFYSYGFYLEQQETSVVYIFNRSGYPIDRGPLLLLEMERKLLKKLLETYQNYH